MGTEPKARQHERIREDVLAAVDAVKGVAEAVPTIAYAIPPAVVLWWTFSRLRRPLPMSASTEEITARLSVATTPYWVILGTLWQGVQGAIAGGVASLVGNLVASMELEVVQKKDPAAEPFPGQTEYKQLGLLDAVYLASMLPMILSVLSHRDAPEARPVMTP